MSKEFFICYHSDKQHCFLYSFQATGDSYLMQWVEHPLEATVFPSVNEAEKTAKMLLSGNPLYERFFIGVFIKTKFTCQFTAILEVFIRDEK